MKSINANLLIFTAILLVFVVSAIALISFNNTTNTDSETEQEINLQETVTKENCISDECLKVDDLDYPVSELEDSVVQALNSAIDDEYKARATYESVINEFGTIRPFSMIIRAEEKHISSLKAIYDKYGLEIPSDPYNSVDTAPTKAENCSIGVQAEIDNASLYRNNLLPAVANYPDIASVFTQLMNDSQNNHLPAFERCSE